MTTPPAERLPDLAVLFPFRAWVRHPALRAWTTWLFVALVAVPPAALALFAGSANYEAPAIMFAAYFAAAWFLVLWVLVRPQNVGGALLGQVVLLALLLEGPIASGMETVLGGDFDNLLTSVVGAGIPEELAKMLPVAVIVLAHRRRGFAPRDTLFLGAVSGLVFGAAEAVTYVTVYMPALGETGVTGSVEAVWRFVSDPVGHALWAGVAGYFLGLAAQYRRPGPWLALAGLGLGVPALLHGLNDWDVITGNALWVVLQVVSALLFLAYARIGLVATPRPTPPAVVPPQPVARPTAAPTAGRHAAPEEPVTAPLVLRALAR
jgi:RsiW-degrading membrane proteinase PrsW (M82 family)